jgi:hypothetical protein
MDESIIIEAAGSAGALILIALVFYAVSSIISRANSLGSKSEKNSVSVHKVNKELSRPERVGFEKEDKLFEQKSSLNRPPVSLAYQKKSDDSVARSFRETEQVNLDEFPKASRVFEYSEQAEITWVKVKSWPRNLQRDFLASIEADPAQDVLSLFERLTVDVEKALRPYSCEAANSALGVAREVGPSAEKEFIEVYELLGQPKNLDEILEKIKEKFLKLSRYDLAVVEMNLPFGNTEAAGKKLERFGYVAISVDGNPNLGGVFKFPNGRSESYYNSAGLVQLMRKALSELKTSGLIE